MLLDNLSVAPGSVTILPTPSGLSRAPCLRIDVIVVTRLTSHAFNMWAPCISCSHTLKGCLVMQTNTTSSGVARDQACAHFLLTPIRPHPQAVSAALTYATYLLHIGAPGQPVYYFCTNTPTLSSVPYCWCGMCPSRQHS